ncbi:MAG TPA: hypothetical protein VHZ02_13445 [Acidimicrobiales bacterium]|nr:hypothetical protein [Acidimicrobiales bacterium]
MLKKLAVGALVAGSLALGTAGTALASTPSSSPSASTPAASQFNCANATKALTRIQKIEGRISAGLPKLTSAQQKAASAGHTKRADSLQKRITRLESVAFKQRLQARSQKIESTCNVSAPSGS